MDIQSHNALLSLQPKREITTSPYDVLEDPAKDITSDEALKGKPMSPDEFLVVNENRQRQREINGDQPEYVNFNNAATKFLLDQVRIPNRIVDNDMIQIIPLLFHMINISLITETKKEVYFEKHKH